jgi:hypothetical protein
MADLAALRRQLGVPDAPVVNEGIACTVAFFKDVIADDPVQWIGYLRGIDFHHPVTVATLGPRKKLIRYESARRGPIQRLPPFGYFTEAGVSPFHTGTSWPSWHYKEFTVVSETRALLSTASSISFNPFDDGVAPGMPVRFDRVSRVGGGPQYIISRTDWPKLLRVSDVHHAG